MRKIISNSASFDLFGRIFLSSVGISISIKRVLKINKSCPICVWVLISFGFPQRHLYSLVVVRSSVRLGVRCPTIRSVLIVAPSTWRWVRSTMSIGSVVPPNRLLQRAVPSSCGTAAHCATLKHRRRYHTWICAWRTITDASGTWNGVPVAATTRPASAFLQWPSPTVPSGFFLFRSRPSSWNRRKGRDSVLSLYRRWVKTLRVIGWSIAVYLTTLVQRPFLSARSIRASKSSPLFFKRVAHHEGYYKK